MEEYFFDIDGRRRCVKCKNILISIGFFKEKFICKKCNNKIDAHKIELERFRRHFKNELGVLK